MLSLALTYLKLRLRPLLLYHKPLTFLRFPLIWLEPVFNLQLGFLRLPLLRVLLFHQRLALWLS